MLDRLANEIIEHAKVGGITIATAESCSAGRLAQELDLGATKANAVCADILAQNPRPLARNPDGARNHLQSGRQPDDRRGTGAPDRVLVEPKGAIRAESRPHIPAGRRQ